MDIDQKCQEVIDARRWSQRQLAAALGVSDKNLISMRKGRRPMPAHALIRLERLRGQDDHSIIEQLLRTAACFAMAFGIFFFAGVTQPTEAQAHFASYEDTIQIMARTMCGRCAAIPVHRWCTR